MTALCPMDHARRRPWFYADRSPARLINSEDAMAAVQSLWDAATDHTPDCLDQAAALEASTRLSAICHRDHARRHWFNPQERDPALAEAINLEALADEFQAVAEYL